MCKMFVLLTQKVEGPETYFFRRPVQNKISRADHASMSKVAYKSTIITQTTNHTILQFLYPLDIHLPCSIIILPIPRNFYQENQPAVEKLPCQALC